MHSRVQMIYSIDYIFPSLPICLYNLTHVLFTTFVSLFRSKVRIKSAKIQTTVPRVQMIEVNRFPIFEPLNLRHGISVGSAVQSNFRTLQGFCIVRCCQKQRRFLLGLPPWKKKNGICYTFLIKAIFEFCFENIDFE